MTDLFSAYTKEYRKRLSLSSKDVAKKFLSGKDLKSAVDYAYIRDFNDRIAEIFSRLNQVVDVSIRPANFKTFLQTHLYEPHQLMLDNDIIPLLTNHGRRPEDVYGSWMRGYVEADCQIQLSGNSRIRLEIQSGYQGINDIKKHKVEEARRVWSEQTILSLCVHFDVFNGLVAFVRLDTIENEDANWISRAQMEGQVVFTIDMNFFSWKLLEKPTHFSEFLDL